MSDEVLWGIHGGRTGDADSLFLKRNCIAIGLDRMGDLSKIEATREAFKEAIAKAFPEKKPGSIPSNAGQLFRFVHEINLGDIAIYPSKRDRMIHLGEIKGSYSYDPSEEISYPNRRAVK